MDCYCQALFLEFPRQEDWNGLPFPSPGDLPKPGIELMSPALQANSLPTEPPGGPSIPLGIWGKMGKLILKEMRPFTMLHFFFFLLIRAAWGEFLFQELLFAHSKIMNLK